MHSKTTLTFQLTNSSTSWTSAVGGLYQVGTTQLIAHIKFAGFQMALKSDIKVLPRSGKLFDLSQTH